jgi:hypothetical protein
MVIVGMVRVKGSGILQPPWQNRPDAFQIRGRFCRVPLELENEVGHRGFPFSRSRLGFDKRNWPTGISAVKTGPIFFSW